MRRHRSLPAVLLLSLTAVAGCSGGSPQGGPTAGGTTGASASPSPSPSAATPTATDQPSGSSSAPPSEATPSTLPNDRLEAASLHTAVLGQNAASTAEERAVVDAWMSYWQGAADTYYSYKVTPEFAKVARGKARSDILDYLADLKAKKQRVVGWARDNVTAVKVDGNTATVRDCTKNFTFSVDADGDPLTNPTPYYDVTGTLAKSQGQWTVVRQRSRELNASCL